jgi:hypothetical protein
MVARNNPSLPLSRDPDVQAVTQALSAPFDPSEIKFKPQIVKNNRALAMAYIDARVIQDRLDEVLGVENWEDAYKILPDGSVMCRLRVKLGDRWISKTDVGSPSEQPDLGDRLKAAFSDALKRAAVKFGIGRYLYRLPAQWVDYDPVKKQITQLPQLPSFAVPKAKKATPRPALEPEDAKGPEPKPQSLPADGKELHRRLREYDAKLAGQKQCALGALLAHVTQTGVKAGYSANMQDWSGPAIGLAVEAVREFEKGLQTRSAA